MTAVGGQRGFHALQDDSARPLDLRQAVERLRLEVHMAHSGSASAEETALAMPEAALLSGFSCPDDFVVRERTLDHYGGGDIYQGEALGTLRHGQGTFTRANGDRYVGDWRYDLREGRGKAQFASGLMYEGDWVNDKAEGRGMARYENGGRYEGEWRGDHRWGWGEHTFPSGDRYEGEWVDDKIEGQGRYTYVDGSFFEGEWAASERVKGKEVAADGSSEYSGGWRQGRRHGQGVQYQRGLFQYIGEWENDLQHGEGKCIYADGSEYSGHWKEGARHGTGKFSSQGSKYEGHWEADKQHGQGFSLLDNKDRYVGYFRAGKRHGLGKAAYGDGTKYEGEWADGVRSGQGTCLYANGDKYQGQWKDDKRHGRGVCKFADGTKFKGEWEDDGWVQSGAEPARCRVAGPGVTRAVAGRPAEFIIQARDEDGNRRLSGGEEFQVALTGPARLAAAVADREDGTYSVGYTATVAGVYQLEITLGGNEHVADSPYPLRVLPAAPCPRRSRVSGEGRSAAVVGAGAEFRVAAHDEFGNSWFGEGLEGLLPLEASLSSGAAECAVRMEATREGEYVCTYSPTQPGFYRLQLTCRGVALPGTPLSVQVRPNGAGAAHVLAPPAPAEGEQSGAPAAAGASPGSAAAVDPVLAASLGAPIRDESRMWAEIAALQYAADGATDGWDSGGEDAAAVAKRRQSPEDAYIEAHPGVPVVENLEDIWLISKLQRERKEKEERQKARQLKELQAGLEGAFGAPAEGPAPAEVAAAVRGIVEADLQREAKKGAAGAGAGAAAAALPVAPPRPAVEELRAAAAVLEELD